MSDWGRNDGISAFFGRCLHTSRYGNEVMSKSKSFYIHASATRLVQFT